MRARTSVFAALAVAAALSLTACQDDGTDTAQGAPTGAATPTGSAASTGSPTASTGGGQTPGGAGKSATPTSAAPTGSDAAGKAAKCRTADLTVTAADRTVTGDATRTVVVELKNRSGKDCAISGYAGVDLQTSAGPLSAERSGEPVVAGVLKSGKSTYFGIGYPANTSGGSGIRITGLVVTPPDETQSVTLPWPGAASLPVTDGSGTPVKVGPVGSAGQGE